MWACVRSPKKAFVATNGISRAEERRKGAKRVRKWLATQKVVVVEAQYVARELLLPCCKCVEVRLSYVQQDSLLGAHPLSQEVSFPKGLRARHSIPMTLL